MIGPEAVDATTLYISDLDPHISNTDLKDAIENEGIEIMTTTVFEGRSPDALKTGIVVFKSSDDAKKAFAELNHLTLGRTEISIMFKRHTTKGCRMTLPTSKNVFVNNVPSEISAETLKGILQNAFGPIESLRLPRGLDNLHRKYGMVLFADIESAEKALKSDGVPIPSDKDNPEATITLGIKPFTSSPERKKLWTNCYLRGFPQSWTEKDIEAWASQFGTVQSCVKKEWMGQDVFFAFVNFTTHDEAVGFVGLHNKPQSVVAIASKPEEGNNTEGTAEEPLTWIPYIKQHMSKLDRSAKNKELMKKKCDVYMTGFSVDTPREEVESLVSGFGDVFSFTIHKEKRRPGSKSKEYPRAYIMYERPEEAQKCIKALNGTTVLGGSIKAELYRPYSSVMTSAVTDGKIKDQYQHVGVPHMAVTAQPAFPPHEMGPVLGAGMAMGARGYQGVGPFLPGTIPTLDPSMYQQHMLGGYPIVNPTRQTQEVTDEMVEWIHSTTREILVEKGLEIAETDNKARSITDLLISALSPDEIVPIYQNKGILGQYVDEMYTTDGVHAGEAN